MKEKIYTFISIEMFDYRRQNHSSRKMPVSRYGLGRYMLTTTFLLLASHALPVTCDNASNALRTSRLESNALHLGSQRTISQNLSQNNSLGSVLPREQNTAYDNETSLNAHRHRRSTQDYYYNRTGSPYYIEQEIHVPVGGVMVIEPGVTMLFDPGVGITVRGVLVAKGTSSERITLTSRSPPPGPLPALKARLVDGPTPVLGRLQLYYKHQWRGVCSNSRNWTAEDLSVVCRQLGFTGGQYYEWQDKPNNDTKSFLLEAPACSGSEASIEDCAWGSRALGGGVCDLHPDLGVACGEYHADWRGPYYWKGVDFLDAAFSQELQEERTQYIKVSKSTLSYVDIYHAGSGPLREVTAAVHAYRTPPVLHNFSISGSVYTAINFTMPGTYVTISAANITNNRGFGVYVNSSTGGVRLEGNCVVSNNQADGVKYNFHHREPIKSADETFMDFCKGSYNTDQIYPLVIVAEQRRHSYSPENCEKVLRTDKENYVFTLHFNYMLSDDKSSASVEVRDRDKFGELLAYIRLQNGTFPASVVSRTNQLYVKFKAAPRMQAIIYMEAIASRSKIPDLSVNETHVANNIGHGVSVENLRSAVYVHKSNLTQNQFGSGLNVRRGSGDVNITYSTIADNVGDGVNVTYEGGLQNVTWSHVHNNTLRGFAVWFNESGQNTSMRHETGIAYSVIRSNLETGVLVGNFCRQSFINITSNTFYDGKEAAVEIGSCWNHTKHHRSVLITNNLFKGNNKLAVKVSPAVNMNLSVEWNQFIKNKLGTILINNEDLAQLDLLPLVARISDNGFTENIGRYVLLLSLTTPGIYQSMLVTRNRIQNNVVSEPYATLSSRSQAAGVVCLGSNNIEVFRNLLDNPKSSYELSSHSFDQSSSINATYNWLGLKNEDAIFNRILDRRDRYNLALIYFHPFLLSNNNMDTPVISNAQMTEPKFDDPDDNTIIGGEINGYVVLTKPRYTVKRDIYVHTSGELAIAFGTVLEFEESIGVMVAGLMRAEGHDDGRVRFTLAGTTAAEERKRMRETFRMNEENEVDMSTDDEIFAGDMTERTFNITGEVPDFHVKLAGGLNALEGRLMMHSGGRWGTVCSHGWTEDAAAVACQQLGYVLNPEDWLLLPGDLPDEGQDAPIVRGNIVCDEFDLDVSLCRSDSEAELENSCRHTDDVGLRCYPRSWAGIRLGITAKESYIKGVVIEKAGLLDYSTRAFKPALQVDFHQHVLQDMEIRDNSQDGVGIIYCDQYSISNPSSRIFRNSAFYRNRRHGISFRQLGANITNSELSYNGGSGLHFNPLLKRADQREMTGWLNLLDCSVILPSGIASPVHLERDKPIRVCTSTLKNEPAQEQTVTFKTDQRNVIGIQVLSPVSFESTENITLYDFQETTISKGVNRWDLRDDQVVFPTTTSSYALTLRYMSGTLALGNVVILLTAVDRRDMAVAGDLRNYRSKWPMVYISNSRITKNDIGISTLHYNRYLTELDDYVLRSANETIQVYNCSIDNNMNQAVYVLSPYRVRHDNHDMAEFTFMINKTKIIRNGRGVVQDSWDIRESNNLFHWVFESVTMEENTGGVSLSLPYVWKFNENFTHSVYVNSSSFSRNTGFGFTVDGHFAKVNVTFSNFEDNTCALGTFAMRGMEKQMFIYDNRFLRNMGQFIVEFNMDSQSAILGDVLAYFEYNIVQNNKQFSVSTLRTRSFQAASTAITIKGLQKVNITHNLFGSNEMDYELLAGLYTARINNLVNVEANWWGSANASYIKERIFDFNDWNNYAIADYEPYLVENRLNAAVKPGSGGATDRMDINALGGRLVHDLVLEYRQNPYVVQSDLTVMPGVTLDVRPGVIIEFYPGIGILVLGRLLAVGMRGNHIKFQPVNLSKTVDYRYSASTAGPLSHRFQRVYDEDGFDAIVESKERKTRSIHSSRPSRLPIDVRLCVEGKCGNRRDGFLEVHNITTSQWVPVCDDRFTERNAQVVCHQLGYNKLHFFMGRDIRTEMYPNALMRVRTWPEPIQCQGTEMKLSECPIRMNGQIFEHRYECSWNGDFVYIACGERHLPNPDLEHWGGIRFSIPSFEHSRVYSRIHDPFTHHHGPYNNSGWQSVMEFVDVMGAGVLHNEFSPAIMALHDAPRLRGVEVSYSAHDGVSLISAVDPFDMLYNRFTRNLGYGISIMGLTGETRESDESSFIPLTNVRLPYHVFGMVDICDSAKEMVIEERILLYYKYDNKPVDCVKIFSSVFDVKNFGIRFLQFNLFNSTWDSRAVLDRLLIYDGDVYNETSTLLATLHANTTNHMKLSKTVGTRMSVQLHATGASGAFGFVAEVLTMPISNIGIGRDVLQNFTYNKYYYNEEGAMYCATAGEVNPWLTVSWSRIEHNGVKLYGNFSTTRAALYFDVQNVQDVFIKNNLIRNNTGGLYILAGSVGAATKLQANITNNLFVETQHRPALYMESRAISAYQHASIKYNDFSFSYSPYHDVITLAQIISDFSYNYAHANLGRHILDIYGFEKVRLPVYQTTSHNSLARNQAVDPTYQGTIIAGSAGQQFVDNVFYNWDNAYEMVAVNESVRCNVSTECTDTWMHQPDVTLRSDVWKTPIDARNNWWGFNKTAAVSGRIHDRLDDITLLRVDFSEYKTDNYSLLYGCEPGYTLVGESCYLYVGAPMTHSEAKDFCRRDNASLPFLQTYYGEVLVWLKEAQLEYLWQTDAIWVQHYDVVTGCAAFVNRQVRPYDCSVNLPFICESDPDNTVDPYAWASDSLVIAAVASTIGCLILVVACVSCWACKSSDRRKDRMSRRNSIRASNRSNRSVISSASTADFSDFGNSRVILENRNASSRPTTAASSTNNGAIGALGAEGGHQCMMEGNLNSGVHGSDDSMNKKPFGISVDQQPDMISFDSRNFNGELDNRYHADPLNATYQNAYFMDTSTVASANLPTPTYHNTGGLSQHQLNQLDQHSEKFSSFSTGAGPGRPHAPSLGNIPRSPQHPWSQSQGNIYNTLSRPGDEISQPFYDVIPIDTRNRPSVDKNLSTRRDGGKTYQALPQGRANYKRRPKSATGLTSSYRSGSVGGGSTQNLPESVMPLATSYGTPAGGSVASGHSSNGARQINDVTPPDEMYNMATLPRDHPPPPRYPSEEDVSRGHTFAEFDNNRHEGPQRDNNGFGGPQRGNNGFGHPQRDNNGFGGPQRDNNGFGGPQGDNNGYGGPQRDNNGYGGPQRDNNGFGGPQRDNNGFGGPQRDHDVYGGPQRDHDVYGSLQRDNNEYGGAQNPHYPAQNVPLNLQSPAQLDASKSLSTSQPLETSM